MLNVEFTVDINPTEYRLKIKGHAGSNIDGADLVCTAASTLACTLAHTLEDSLYMLEENGFKAELNEGDSIIFCRPKELYEGNIRQTFYTILEGYELLANHYPDNVKFSMNYEM